MIWIICIVAYLVIGALQLAATVEVLGDKAMVIEWKSISANFILWPLAWLVAICTIVAKEIQS